MLGWHVQQHGLTAEALRSFEKERIPRICKIAEQETVNYVQHSLAWCGMQSASPALPHQGTILLTMVADDSHADLTQGSSSEEK